MQQGLPVTANGANLGGLDAGCIQQLQGCGREDLAHLCIQRSKLICIAGTRITVQSVLELVREGLAVAEICRDYYPDLLPEDVGAFLQYEIDLISVEDIRLAETA